MLCRALAFSLLLAPVLAVGQDEGPLKSGPQPGAILESSFHPFNLNGGIGKGRYHCLVCEYGLRPVVMIFAQEATAAKEPALDTLLTKLDEAVARDPNNALRAFIVFLSPQATSALTDAKVSDPAKLVQEAADRQELLARLKPRADKLKHVVVAAYPSPGPAGYSLSPKAAVTVVLYNRHKVTDNFAFAEGGLNDKAAAAVLEQVHALVGKKTRIQGTRQRVRSDRQYAGTPYGLAATDHQSRAGGRPVIPDVPVGPGSSSRVRRWTLPDQRRG